MKPLAKRNYKINLFSLLQLTNKIKAKNMAVPEYWRQHYSINQVLFNALASYYLLYECMISLFKFEVVKVTGRMILSLA